MAKDTIKKYMKYNILCLRLIGLWTDEEEFFGTKFYWMYCLFVNVCIIGLFNLCQAIYFIKNITDLELLASSGCVALMFLMSNIRPYFYLRNWSLIKNLIAQVEQDDFQPKSKEQKKQAHLFLRIQPGIHLIYVVAAMIVMPLWILNPVLNHPEEKNLPFLAWYPYDTKNSSLRYKLTYVHQSVAVVYIGNTNINLDLIAFGLISYIGVECDLLADTLRNIFDFSAEKLERKDVAVKRIDVAEKRRLVMAEMENMLTTCVHVHRKILRFTEDTNKFFNFLIFLQFSNSLLSTCLSMLELTMVAPFSVEFIVTAVFQMVIFIELIFYCWFGNEVIFKSMNIANALYESPWVDCPDSYKKKLLFFMVRTQKPIQMHALNFFVLSLPTCTAILRASWSFFAMLHQLHDEGK